MFLPFRRLALCLSVALMLDPAFARAQENTVLPKLPDPIQNLVNEGAQIRYLGRDYGMDAWITIKGGQEQYFYVQPDGKSFIMGVMFDEKGKLVTVEQVGKLRADGDEVLDQLADDYGMDAAAATKAEADKKPVFKSPSEQLFYDIENSNWVPLGEAGAPILYSFIDPQCPHCHDFVESLLKDYIDTGKVQLRMIPVGFRDETRAQAAFLLATPDAGAAWRRHLAGDKDALPARPEINQQGVQRNLAIMQSWKFNVTPMIVYRGKGGEVKIVRGQPKDLPAFVADLGSRV